MNGNEIQRLAHSINAHRPDWMISSLTSFITRNMSTWTYRDASVALTFVATDPSPDGTPASQTPKRVLENGPWRIAASAGGPSELRTYAPRREEECRRHAGRHASNCGLCAVEDIPAYNDPAPLTEADAKAAEALRAEIRARRERRNPAARDAAAAAKYVPSDEESADA